MAEARRYGMKLILSLANNYETFGGKKQYVDWARGQGQSLGSDDDFFTNSLVKGFYKNHVRVCFFHWIWIYMYFKGLILLTKALSFGCILIFVCF